MRNARVTRLGDRERYAYNILSRIVAVQGYHQVDRLGYKSNALRVQPGTVPEEELKNLRVVFLEETRAWIARVQEVKRVSDAAFDLYLSPFRTFLQSGYDRITDHGTHLLYGQGAIHSKPPYVSRTGIFHRGSYKPSI